MDVPLAFKEIRIHYGFKGYDRKSSTCSLQTVVDGLSAFIYYTFKSTVVVLLRLYRYKMKLYLLLLFALASVSGLKAQTPMCYEEKVLVKSVFSKVGINKVDQIYHTRICIVFDDR